MSRTNNINNYNKFLKSLDSSNDSVKKDSSKNLSNDLSKDSVKKDSTNSGNDYSLEKEIIDILTKMIEENYINNNLNSSNFSGLNNDISFANVNANTNVTPVINANIKIINTNVTPHVTKKQDRGEIEPIIKEHINIDTEINNVQDILSLIDKYKVDRSIKYNINLRALHNIKEPLIELNNMVGMEDLKTNIVDQILYFAQDLHKGSNGDFSHTVIYGPPGTGKTEIAKIMGKIYSKLGVLSKGTFKKVTRTDLIAGFLGQTAIKTKEVIKECIGGVLFIDEAYALGNSENKDIFSKECIDTLCEALSDHKHELMVIIAGYEKELNECFFRCNQGLDSRFTWRFKTDEYSADNLRNIFIKKVKEIGWTIEDLNVNVSISVNWFKKNMVYFKFFGRDMETLLAKVKIAHGRRVFCKPENEKKQITMTDMENGFKMYLKNDNVKNRKDSDNMKQVLSSLYA
jgi:SpoVK/Ycf46/Vps4 family AAA+-type ATPase